MKSLSRIIEVQKRDVLKMDDPWNLAVVYGSEQNKWFNSRCWNWEMDNVSWFPSQESWTDATALSWRIASVGPVRRMKLNWEGNPDVDFSCTNTVVKRILTVFCLSLKIMT